MKTLLVVMLLVLSLVGTAVADQQVYYIVGDRDVIKVINDTPGVNAPEVIDCQKKNNSDPIGCIIATAKVKGQKQMAAKKRQKQLASVE